MSDTNIINNKDKEDNFQSKPLIVKKRIYAIKEKTAKEKPRLKPRKKITDKKPNLQLSTSEQQDNTKVVKPIIVNSKNQNNVDDWYNLENWFKKGVNYISRQWDKNFNTEPEPKASLKAPEISQDNDTSQKVVFKPKTFTGDTIRVDKRRYFLPESIDVSEYIFGARNRGENTPIKSEAASITTFHPFVPYGKHSPYYNTYIGINKDGKLIAGDISQFKEGDYLTGTYSNKVKNFKKDASGKQLWKSDAAHGNSLRNVPIIQVIDSNGNLKDGSLNILTGIGKDKTNGNTFGNISGGRVLVRVGNELRLLSGSIDNIEAQFEEMKKRNNADSGIFYILDNGSYNRGLRTYDGNFTKEDLKDYDLQNNGGGNFLYIKNPVSKTYNIEHFLKDLKNQLK